MRLRLATAAAFLIVPALAGDATAQEGSAHPSVVGARALVLLEQTTATVSAADVRASARALLVRHSLERVRPDVPEVGLVTVRVPRGLSFGALAARLRQDDGVRSVEPELRRQLRFVPNDPALSQPDPGAPPGTPYQWGLARQGFPGAWDIARGAGTTVGVIDTALDGGHPEFAGKIARAVDKTVTRTGTGDENGHGSHVAGLACAATNNGVGLAGTGFDCRLVVEKSDLTSSSIVASIVDATDSGADVINMSFGGGGPSRAERDALAYAFGKDVVLVAAAADRPVANQGFPASYLQPTGSGSKPGEGRGLVVTAAAFSDARAPFAGVGSQISLAAYGFFSSTGPPGIFSTFPGNTTEIESGEPDEPLPPCTVCRTTFNGDARYAYLAGTSMAAPQVAGAAALVRSAKPKLDNRDVIGLIKLHARRFGGWTTDLGWGILDAGAAVRAAVVFDKGRPVTRRRGRRTRSVASQVFRLRWRGSDSADAGARPSGIRSYDVHGKRSDGRYRHIARTKRSSLRYRGARGRTYLFYVRGRDRAGNVEPTPKRADFVVRVRR